MNVVSHDYDINKIKEKNHFNVEKVCKIQHLLMIIEIKKETDYNLGGREYPQTDKNHLKKINNSTVTSWW